VISVTCDLDAEAGFQSGPLKYVPSSKTVVTLFSYHPSSLPS
jgi:hypothetical protein